jgi:HEAT repeat protein
MFYRMVTCCAVLMLACTSAWSQIKISNGDGATIDDLIREQAFVTILLEGNVPDANLTITGINKDTITFLTHDGRDSAYPLTMVKSIRVQEKRTAQKQSVFSKGSLSREEQAVVDRAAVRLESLWEAEPNAALRMAMASYLTILGNKESKFYLQGHAESNDNELALVASMYLFSIGEEVDKSVIREGFLNGNRNVRALAATLAGVLEGDDFIRELREMSDDPTPDVFVPAVRALARLGDRDVIPRLMKALTSLKQPIAEAAIYGLVTLGGDDVISELKQMRMNEKASVQFRILRILYALGDEEAAVEMREKGLTTYATEEVAGLLLGENGDWDGLMWIREYMTRQKDPNGENLTYRTHLAAALYDTAQAQAKIEFQKLMRKDETQFYAKGRSSDTNYKKTMLMLVKAEACAIIGRTGDKTMLSLLNTPMEAQNSVLAMSACNAIAMIADPTYRARSEDFYVYTGTRESTLAHVFR